MRKEPPEKYKKPYNAAEYEKTIYEQWESSGVFNPDICVEKGYTKPDAKPFTIIMPPPNANGHLHVGHGLFVTLQDIMTRYRRMRGFKTLWVPGADHAGFETQIVYEKKLEKEGRSRFEMSREQLYEEIYNFTIENKKHMEDEVRLLGASCDWSREKFTLDDDVVLETQNTFKKMYKEGLVYRGGRIVNWCSKHQTSLSDVETENKEETTRFYYFKYGPFTIGTARPETKFGDKYVVVHPDDQRYTQYKHGDKLTVEWINGPIEATVIKDTAIDMEFGTGAMTITPWHSAIDFEIAERHGLDKEQIIDERGKLLPIAGEFAGMKIADAREKIVEKLAAKGLVEKIDEKYVHNKKVCFKCTTAIEPQIKDQWFVKMRPLADLALKAVRDENQITFYSENYRKIFTYWMENTIDWNISRQIVWGIPIPAQVCTQCNTGFIDKNPGSDTCEKCEGALKQETDTFDTWFSSGQWPLFALGYPNSPDMQNFYPTDVMETGHDLIFKWIPRMVIFGLYLTGKVPFTEVYMHGLVNDASGQKMSKSKGNVISPVTMIEKYGADAMRIALTVANPPGSDMALSEERINGYKKFGNKLWNITRFVLESTEIEHLDTPEFYSVRDTQVIEEFMALKKELLTEMDEHKYYIVSEKIYHYIWHEFADNLIEESKTIFKDHAVEEIESRKKLLITLLRECVKLLHPFMPFITEAIWTDIKKASESMLIVQKI